MPPQPSSSSKFTITPPLLNSACPWATTFEDLEALYACPYTGAVTTRTCLLKGFDHDPVTHQHVFFRAGESCDGSLSFTADSVIVSTTATNDDNDDDDNEDSSLPVLHRPRVNPVLAVPGLSSLNTYGYSPITLAEYLGYAVQITRDWKRRQGQEQQQQQQQQRKPFILSVTGTPDEIVDAYAQIVAAAAATTTVSAGSTDDGSGDGGGHNHEDDDDTLNLALEINLSCPNIAGKPPPAYAAASLMEYLVAVAACITRLRGAHGGHGGGGKEILPWVGVKLPPYTWSGQFEMVVECLRAATKTKTKQEKEKEKKRDDDIDDSGAGTGTDTFSSSVVDFITCTNTLGSSLVVAGLDDGDGSVDHQPVLGSENGSGIGGLAGAALHPLALGNVNMFRRLLDQYPETRDVVVVGVGGVEDRAGFQRMVAVGAGAVACASALGRYGLEVFEKITKGE